MKELLQLLARGLVKDEAQVSAEETEEAVEGEAKAKVVLRLQVAKDDLGRVIGKHGTTARALRTVLGVLAAERGRTAVLEIEE